ncbi:PDZ domain-containing protein [bacterium]|nr:PDZ domain-containing protein [bacterium]
MKLGKSAPGSNSKISKLALYALLAFVAFTIADLTIIYFRDLMIPNQAPPKKVVSIKPPAYVDRSQFSTITNRNLFSSTGVMPEAITAKKQDEKKDNEPTPSQLPIVVIGTLVHSDPTKSIVAVEIKSKNMSGSFSAGAEIEGMAKVERIERNIVYIRNLNTGVLEYLEMNKTGNKVAFGASKNEPAKPAGNEVLSTGSNQFTISRANLLKYTNDLSSVLMQARAVPNRDPNTGEINGFRILDMQPGSIYEQLGLQRMDVIKGVNGEPVDSVQKAMEMYNTLKNGTQVKMNIERGGKTETFTYDVK